MTLIGCGIIWCEFPLINVLRRLTVYICMASNQETKMIPCYLHHNRIKHAKLFKRVKVLMLNNWTPTISQHDKYSAVDNLKLYALEENYYNFNPSVASQ